MPCTNVLSMAYFYGRSRIALSNVSLKEPCWRLTILDGVCFFGSFSVIDELGL